MIRRPPRSTLDRSSAASDVYKRQVGKVAGCQVTEGSVQRGAKVRLIRDNVVVHEGTLLSLIHISEPTRPY